MKEIYNQLILKKDNANRVKDFRPRSLVMSLYKIIANTIVDRLRKVLPTPSLISRGL